MNIDDEELMVIQAVIMPSKEIVDRIFWRGWSTMEFGNRFHHYPFLHRYQNSQTQA